MRHLTLLLAMAACSASANDLARFDDEFERRDSLGDWEVFHAKFGWPDKIRALDVGHTTDGSLHLQPYHSAWVRDLNAPFLYRTLSGDFDVRARVRVRGDHSDIPGGTWSLGGLMARVPNGASSETWQPRRENWHFITTGVGMQRGETMTETKATFNSYSSLKLRPFSSGWVELRLVRVGMALVALARSDESQPWQVRDRWYRMESNPQMQVGLIAYTTSDDVPPSREDPERINRTLLQDACTDMTFEVDWIRFSRPQIAAADWYGEVSGNPLADPNLSEQAMLELIGG